MRIYLIIPFLVFLVFSNGTMAQKKSGQSDLDRKVEKFLKKHQYRWHDMNIPTEDGKILYNIIIENNYKHAVEIGTSTGHSAIWIAWALSKTGGKLVTVEINETRYRKALENFKEAGLSDYIDARLGDAHKLVPRIRGPIDFVFCDADKGWYKNYFESLEHKIKDGGCFVAHNVNNGYHSEVIDKFIDYINGLSHFTTTIKDKNSSGISISYKKH